MVVTMRLFFIALFAFLLQVNSETTVSPKFRDARALIEKGRSFSSLATSTISTDAKVKLKKTVKKCCDPDFTSENYMKEQKEKIGKQKEINNCKIRCKFSMLVKYKKFVDEEEQKCKNSCEFPPESKREMNQNKEQSTGKKTEQNLNK